MANFQNKQDAITTDRRFWLAVSLMVSFLVYLLIKYPS